MIRAETGRCDIVGLSKVTTKSLASGTGSQESNESGESKLAGEVDPGHDLVFLRVKISSNVFPASA